MMAIPSLKNFTSIRYSNDYSPECGAKMDKKCPHADTFCYYIKNISSINTTRQHITDTGKSPSPSQAAAMPMTSAAPPASGDAVASMMAGKVITESVT